MGGDPKKVTILGESAGALSVDALVTTSPKNPPFPGAILQSGQAALGRFIGRTNSTVAWLSLVEKVNCTSAKKLIECVRKVAATTLKDIIERNVLSFNPVGDDITFPTDAAGARKKRQVANVPVMLGTDAHEGRAFNVANNNLTAYLTETFQIPELISAVRAAYPQGTLGLVTDYDVISAVFTDLVFTCPAKISSEASASAGYDTYRYFYAPTFPNINPALPLLGIDLKAFHSAEIPMAFGAYSKDGTTAQQVALSNYMRGVWAGFARTPKTGPGWNKLGTYSGTDLGVLGLNGSSGVTVTKREVRIASVRILSRFMICCWRTRVSERILGK